MPRTIKSRSGKVLELPTATEDAAINAGIAQDDETEELDDAWIKRARPAREVLAPDVYAGLLEINRRAGVRGPQKAPTKQVTTIRFDADVLAALRASGPGWQTRVNDAVRDLLRRSKL